MKTKRKAAPSGNGNEHTFKDTKNKFEQAPGQQPIQAEIPPQSLRKEVPTVAAASPVVGSSPLDNFIRVGDKYFEKVTAPRVKGLERTTLELRSNAHIVIFYGQSALKNIKGYDAFVNIPNNVKHTPEIKNCYNIYHETPLEPIPGEWVHIKLLLNHIFGEHYELGLDYLQLMYFSPTQMLPVLCLVSKENQTGKTTYGNFTGMLLGDNFSSIGSAELKGDFNSTYAGKLCCMVDESYVKKETVDKVKMLATSETIQLRKMRTDHQSIDNFTKFILCSNKEDNFIIADEYDIRYWVRKVPVLKNNLPKFDYKLREEAPHFLHFLQNRTLSTKNESRMWFNPKLIETEQLNIVRRASMNAEIKKLLLLLRDNISDAIEDNSEYNEETVFYYSAAEIEDKFGKSIKVEATKVSKALDCDRSEDTKYKQRRYKSIVGTMNYTNGTELNRKCFGSSIARINEVLDGVP